MSPSSFFPFRSYDYWYQPYHNVMVSSEWGAPNRFSKGFNPADVAEGKYGTHLNVFDWKEKKLLQRIDLGMEGVMPLEIRLGRKVLLLLLQLLLLSLSQLLPLVIEMCPVLKLD